MLTCPGNVCAENSLENTLPVRNSLVASLLLQFLIELLLNERIFEFFTQDISSTCENMNGYLAFHKESNQTVPVYHELFQHKCGRVP